MSLPVSLTLAKACGTLRGPKTLSPAFNRNTSLSHLKNELPLPDKKPLVLSVVIVQRWAAFRRSEGVVSRGHRRISPESNRPSLFNPFNVMLCDSCGRAASTTSIVVPAHAGTHNHECPCGAMLQR